MTSRHQQSEDVDVGEDGEIRCKCGDNGKE